MRISFGPFAFDPQSRLLWRDGAEIALPPRVLAVLEVLIERAGQVVARQDLLDRVWKDAFVTDTSLAEAVSFLRQALGDDPQSPRFIQTVHRRGYRFLVTPTSDKGLTPPAAETGERGQTPILSQVSGAETVRGGLYERDEAKGVRGETSWQLVPWSAAILCAALAAAAVRHAANQPPPETPPVARFEFHTAPGTAFDRDAQPIAISPDGRSFAWSACETATGRCAIYVRPIDRLDAQPLAGTEDGRSPVFSPDGRWIAFFAGGALKKIAVAGGAPSTLASAPDPGGAAWGTEGGIVFAGSAAGGLSHVDEQGGAVKVLTRPHAETGEVRHRHPAWLAGRANGQGGALVFTIARAPGIDLPGDLGVVSTASALVRTLRSGVTRAAPAGTGYLLLATATDLQAATFDEDGLVLAGPTDAVPAPTEGLPQFAAGANALAVVLARARPQRTWTDGADASALSRLSSIAVAPGSRRAAGVIFENNGADVWIADLASGGLTRLTFGDINVSPVWSADGGRVFYATRPQQGPFTVVSREVEDRNATAATVTGAPPQSFPSSVTTDGRLALTTYGAGRTAVVIVGANAAPRILTDGPFDEANAVFSPDGRWIALESTESGRLEVVVRSTTDARRIAISRDGGTHPRWSEDGRAIYYESGRRLMKMAFAPETGTAPGVPAAVLDRAGERALAVAPSGRILVERQPEADTAVIMLQWLRELRQRLPLPVTSPR
jgi:serine/threonine-protein kinase